MWVHWALLIFEALLGLFTAVAAYSLFTNTPPSVAKSRAELRFPRWYWFFAGIVATIGAIGLFAGLVYPEVGALAALWMVAYFIVAALTHLVRGDLAHIGQALIFLVICAGLVALRWGDLTPFLPMLSTIGL